MNSRAKGKRGELELVHYLKANGIIARRGQQFAGGTDSPDVIAQTPLHTCHIEVKRRESGNLYHWLEQATKDASPEKYPVVVHKRNGKEWVAIIDLKHFLRIMNGYVNA